MVAGLAPPNGWRCATLTAFTYYGVDNLAEIVKMAKADPKLLRYYTPSE
jgi:hypothetical protein